MRMTSSCDPANVISPLMYFSDGSSEDFCDMFWGDLNPSEKYMSGEIKLQGSQQDVMRIDAISMVAFLDT